MDIVFLLSTSAPFMPRLIGSAQRRAGMLALPVMGLLWLLLGAAIRNKNILFTIFIPVRVTIG